MLATENLPRNTHNRRHRILPRSRCGTVVGQKLKTVNFFSRKLECHGVQMSNNIIDVVVARVMVPRKCDLVSFIPRTAARNTIKQCCATLYGNITLRILSFLSLIFFLCVSTETVLTIWIGYTGKYGIFL